MVRSASNETHASTTDPEARLYRKGPGKEDEALPRRTCVVQSCNDDVVDACLTEPIAMGYELITALEAVKERPPVTPILDASPAQRR